MEHICISASFFPWLVCGPSVGRMTWIWLPCSTTAGHIYIYIYIYIYICMYVCMYIYLATLQYHRWAGKAGCEANSNYTVDRSRLGLHRRPEPTRTTPSTGEADLGYVRTCQ
jgi:hypothetical protein